MGTGVQIEPVKIVLVPRARTRTNHRGRQTVPAAGDRRRRKYRMRLRRQPPLALYLAAACVKVDCRVVSCD
jgi:hypothetical protein